MPAGPSTPDHSAASAAEALKKRLTSEKYTPSDRAREHASRVHDRRAPFSVPRMDASGGESVTEYLLGLFKKNLPPLAEGEEPGSPKWQMFSEIVTRCAFDVAGNMYASNAEKKKYNALDDIFESYAKRKSNTIDDNRQLKKDNLNPVPLPYTYGQQIDGQAAAIESPYRKVLRHIPLYKKGIVQTPHPTETLNRQGIQAEVALHHAIEEYAWMFAVTPDGKVTPDDRRDGVLLQHMKNLYKAMTPVMKPMTIPHEINRSIELSALTFNALPHMMQAIIDPAIRPRVQAFHEDGAPVLDHKGEPVRYGLRNTQPLTFDELKHFGRLIEACTWSPGDRDSKPDVTTEMLAYGIEQNRVIMSLTYAVKIAEIMDSMKPPATSAPDNQKKAYDKLESVFRQILAGIPEAMLPQEAPPKFLLTQHGMKAMHDAGMPDSVLAKLYLLENKEFKTEAGFTAALRKALAPEEIKSYESLIMSQNAHLTLGDRFLNHYKRQANGNGGAPPNKENVERKIRIFAHGNAPAEPFSSPQEMVQAVEEVRQLQGVSGIAKFNGSEIINALDVLVAQMHSFGNHALRAQIRENAGEMHEKVMAGVIQVPEIARLLKIGPRDGRKRVAEKMLAVLDRDGSEADYLRQRLQNWAAIAKPPKGTRGDDAYETLSGMALAAKHPDAIPHYLIAECRDSTDILEALALLKLMEPKDAKKHVEIVPLFEHRQPTDQSAAILKEVYANPVFLKHHAAIGQANDDAFIVKGLVKETGLETVADEKRSRIPQIKKSDSRKIIAEKKAEKARIEASITGEDEKEPATISIADVKRSRIPKIAKDDSAETIAEKKAAKAKIEASITAADEETKIRKISIADVKRQYVGNLTDKNAVKEKDKTRYVSNPESKLEHHLTVAEVKQAFGIEIRDGDEKKKIHHTKMVMFAGSDIMKSAGPAGAAVTQHAIEHMRETLLNLDQPVLLIDYIGLGGGVHRSQPTSATFETTQGRSLRQTAGSIAQKAVMTMSRFIRNMLGQTSSGQQIQEESWVARRAQDENVPAKTIKLGRLAQLNLGNLAGFPTKLDASRSDKEKTGGFTDFWSHRDGSGKRSGAAMDSYQKLYDSPEFAAMLAFSADKFAKLTSYAARPAGRLSAAGDTKDYPPVVDVEKLRAIGYGAALNVSGSCTSLYYGVGDFMHAKAILGNKESIDTMHKLYLHDPKTQDVVNRATFGVAMADMDAAWKYLGKERKVSGKTVAVSDKGKRDKPQSVEALASTDTNPLARKILDSYEHEVGHASRKERLAWLGKLSLDDKRTLAIHSLAKVDMEYQQVAQIALRLHSVAAGKPTPEADLTHIHEQIIDMLPEALKSQITSSRKYIGQARHELAEQFHQSWHAKNHVLRGSIEEVRAKPEVYDPIYYRMGACFECFENVPRAFTRPYWALAMENTRQHGPAQNHN